MTLSSGNYPPYPMKTYLGEKDKDTMTNVTVRERDDFTGELKKVYTLPLRLDLVNHSPTGFSWGYGGSGPHQLAVAILADWLGDDKEALALKHRLVIDVISNADQDQNFYLDSLMLSTWLLNVRREEAAKA